MRQAAGTASSACARGLPHAVEVYPHDARDLDLRCQPARCEKFAHCLHIHGLRLGASRGLRGIGFHAAAIAMTASPAL
jgi:hypothetical protein